MTNTTDYGFRVTIPNSVKLGHVSKWGPSGIDRIPYFILTKNVAEPKMIPFVRVVKQKDHVVWPQRETFINDASKLFDFILRYVQQYWSNNGKLFVFTAPSKSKFNTTFVDRTTAGLGGVQTIHGAFKKNEEKDILINPHSFRTEWSRRYIGEAHRMLLKLKDSEKEASTASIGRIGFRRYFHNFYGIQNEEVLKQIENHLVVVFDDSMGEGNTTRDLYSLLKKFNPKEIMFVALAYDRSQDKE